MLFGTIIFTCDNCKKVFKGLNIEYNACAFSTPQKCPFCGSYHTKPGHDDKHPLRSIYERIWKDMDDSGEHDVTCFYDVEKYNKSIAECEEWNRSSHKEDEGCTTPNNKKETFGEQLFIGLCVFLFLIIEAIKSLKDAVVRFF